MEVMDGRSKKVYKVLVIQQNSWIKNEVLRRETGLAEAEIRRVINCLRAIYKIPVCSDVARGYKLPKNLEEAEETEKQLQGRLTMADNALMGFRLGMERMFGNKGKLF